MSQQRGYGLGGVFRSIGRYANPILGEVGKIAATTGAKLAEGLISDVIEGKDLKKSARERGKEAGRQSLDLGTKRVVQEIQGPPKTVSKAISNNDFQRFPTISNDFQRFPTIPNDFQRFPNDFQGDFQRFPKAVKRPRSQSGGPKRKKGGKRKNPQRGGSKKKRKTVGVVFPRAMTQKQRRSLPPKDIFG